MKFRKLGVVVGVLAAVCLVACKKSEQGATQVAAKVNSEEISVHQINFLLQRAGVKPEQTQAASRQALQRLVDESLLVQKAVEHKLDRDPAVVQQLEAVKRELLARAYLERLGSNVAKPDANETGKFFAQHPELFSQRKVYSLREIDVAADQAVQARLREFMPSAKSMDDVVAYLRKENINFRSDAFVKPAEQLPLGLVPKLQQMKDGQIAAVPSASGMALLQLLGSKEAPVTAEQAKLVIEQFLVNKAKTELVQKEMKSLRDSAKIEYKGEFADLAKSQSIVSVASGPVAAPDPSSSPAALPLELEKGIAAGIK